MNGFSLNRLVKTGTKYADSLFEERRIVAFNYLILFGTTIGVILVGITYFFGLDVPFIISIVASFLFSTCLWLNHRGAIAFSKASFIVIGVLSIVASKLYYIEQGYTIDTENMLFAGMALCMFLINGSKKHAVYWLIFITLIGVKIHEYDVMSEALSMVYVLNIINLLVVSVVLYLFLYVFHSISINAFYQADQHERRLNSLLNNVPVFMAMIDLAGDFLLVNESYASKLNLRPQDIVGKNRTVILPDNILKKHTPMFKKALQGHSVSFLENTLLPDGSTLHANGKYEPIIDDNGVTVAVTVCIDDVSEMIATQDALKAANETKDKLFSIIAHDIKSPLNLFQSILNLKNDQAISNDQFLTYQESIKTRLSKLTGTVNELLDWSRMQLGGINAYPIHVCVNTIVEENISLFESLIERKNIEFEVDVSNQLMVWIDENHFKVALRNLIHNAIKYTSGGGFVKIIGNRTDQETIVHVKDSGVGMNAEQLASIVKKEIQTSQLGTDKEMGSGLGLSLSLGLLEKNNCNVSVESAIDKGTTFSIRIPHETEVNVN